MIAQENVYNPRYGRWKWVDVAERIIDIPAISCDHSWKVVEEIPATCIKTGKAHKVCEFCETEKEEILPVTGKHVMGKWKVTKSASVVKEGLKERNCTVCGRGLYYYFTFTLIFTVFLPDFTVITTVPFFFAVITPFEVTSAIFLLEEL